MEHTGRNGSTERAGRVRRLVPVLVGAGLFAAAAAAPAHAAPGETRTLCGSVATPPGWVDVNWGNSGACGVSTSPNVKLVKQLDGLPVGTRVDACATTLPPQGWRQVNTYHNSGCRAFLVPGTQPNAWLLERVS
ncbi:hypothetical protein [Streptomyces sp. NPDC007100]|uniref:hypothetical protein n=1 Tax=unclassified Streptomyces TaxID=2593676 RepID=UPI0033EC71EE